MKTLSDAQRGYVAGILDGEGTFCFYVAKWERGVRYVPTVSIEMSDRRVINRIAEMFDRPVKERKRGSNKRMYTVRFSADQLRDLIPQVIDHLIVKKEQAQLMMLWVNTFKCNVKSLNFANQRLDLQKMFYDYGRWLNGKSGEFRGSLSNEAILSQALGEISVKVQRLEDEAKDILRNRITEVIKSSGRISKSDIYRRVSCRTVFELDKLMADLPVTSYVENRTRYYVYAGNASTSARDQETGHDIVRTEQRCSEA